MPQYSREIRADQIGPTVDGDAERAVPLYRHEPHEILAGRVPIKLLRPAPAPVTTSTPRDLIAGRVPIEVRYGNSNPANAGTGTQTGVWSVVDPQRLQGTEAPTRSTLLVLVAGLVLGAAAGIVFKARPR